MKYSKLAIYLKIFIKKRVNLKIQKILTVILDINIIQSLEIFIPNLVLYLKKILKEKYLISESYLGLIDEIKLNFKLGCLPKLNSMEPQIEKKIDWEFRHKFILNNFNPENDFEKIIKHLIILQTPTTYFENYKKMCLMIKDINWPSNPKIIFTSHFLQKTKQAFYTAEKIEKRIQN